MKDWLEAFRLRTLPLSIAGILTGSMFALLDGFWSGKIFGLALSTTLLFQILSNLANDLGDSLKGADNEGRIGPMRSVQSGKISKIAMRNAVIATATLSLLSAGLLIYVSAKQLSEKAVYAYIVLAIACVIAAITYTVGKKAYGYNGLGDFFVFVFFGLISVMGVYPLYSSELPGYLWLPAITIGLLSTAVLNLNNMRDQENDRKVGKRTMVVKMGPTAAKNYHYLLFFIAITTWIGALVIKQHWIGFISLIPFILFIKHMLFVKRTTVFKELDSQLKIVALGTFFVSLLFLISVFLKQWI